MFPRQIVHDRRKKRAQKFRRVQEGTSAGYRLQFGSGLPMRAVDPSTLQDERRHDHLGATARDARRATPGAPGITWKDGRTWLVRKAAWSEPKLVRLSLLTASTNSPEVSGSSLPESSASARGRATQEMFTSQPFDMVTIFVAAANMGPRKRPVANGPFSFQAVRINNRRKPCNCQNR